VEIYKLSINVTRCSLKGPWEIDYHKISLKIPVMINYVQNNYPSHYLLNDHLVYLSFWLKVSKGVIGCPHTLRPCSLDASYVCLDTCIKGRARPSRCKITLPTRLQSCGQIEHFSKACLVWCEQKHFACTLGMVIWKWNPNYSLRSEKLTVRTRFGSNLRNINHQ
jgi:hypothetical protein